MKISDLFCGFEIVSVFFYGDFWSGNVVEDDTGFIVYDFVFFYGYFEFELVIVLMFGGFFRFFFIVYYRKIFKVSGFDRRLLFY